MLLAAGVSLDEAEAAMVLLHGRGASARDILIGAGPLLDAPRFAFLAPEAEGGAWYPNPFTAPLESNEPWLSQALGTVGEVIAKATAAGIPDERIILLGFSQGACLASEYAARNARRWGGVVAWSGALIGPPGTSRDYSGSFEGTPALFGCGDQDPYIPADLVREAGAVYERLGAAASVTIYSGMGHIVNADETAQVRRMMAALTAARRT